MKTKYLISALALPALLAACVNDDFEAQKLPSTSVESDLLKGRATGELMLSAQKAGYGNQADTRVDGEMNGASGAISWWWQPGDQLGAVVVDYAGTNRDYIVDASEDYLLTNFPFNAEITEPAQGANFSTPTAVVEGGYFFYNQYDGENIRRGNISHVLPQYVDVEYGREAGLSQVGTDKENGANFFISPITKVAVKDADGETLRTPISLTSIYSVLQLRFNLELRNEFAGKDVKIYKVELENGEGKGTFKNSFVLNPAELAKVQYEVWQEAIKNNEAYKNVFVQPGEAGSKQAGVAMIDATNLEQNRDLIEDAMGAVLEKLQDPESLASCFKEGDNKLIYQLKEPYSFEEHDNATMDLMVLIPSDTYKLKTTQYEQGRDGAKSGILEMTVYTSEGIYRSYVITADGLANWGQGHPDEYMPGQFTFMRGSKTNVTRTIRIGGDVSNITFYDFQTSGFPVATKEDWNYAIDYLNSHTGQFGGGEGEDGSTGWNIPKLNLSNYGGEPIEVDAEHYFPDMRVIYRTAEGETNSPVLKLVGQSSYVLDPSKVIMDANGQTCGRPTLLVEEQPEATVTFAGDNVDEEGNVIKNHTDAWKLNSDAKINVGEGQVINFEQLESHTALNIAKGANVTVKEMNGTETLTEGTVDLAAGNEETETRFTVNQPYTNNGKVTINEYAAATLVKAAENNGIIDVTGKLVEENVLTNTENAELNVRAWAVGMNNKKRGEADLEAMMNAGIVTLEARKQTDSGTYGGEMTVHQNLHNTSTGEILINGLFTVEAENEGLLNQGIIKLGVDPYAKIRIEKSFSAEANTGKIVLLAPEEYEFFDDYHLSEQTNPGQYIALYNGVIEATLDQATYEKVLKRYGEYKNQERAWDVINKVIVDGNLNLGVEMGKKLNGEESNKNFFLADGATLNAQGNLTLESLTTKGAATLTAQNANTVVTVKKNVNVAAATSLTVAEKVKLALNYGDGDVMLNVAGTLTNNGWIESADDNDNTITFDPEFDIAQKGVIYANIEAGATLKNLGKLSRESEAKYSEKKNPAYGRLEDLVELLYRGTDTTLGDFAGTFGDGPRVEVMDCAVDKLENDGKFSTTEDAWKATINYGGRAVTKTVLLNLLANGTKVTISQDGQSYSALAVTFSSSYPNYSYVLYLPEGFDSIEGIVDLTDDARQTACDIEDGTLETMPYLAKTWFYVENAGVLNLSESVWAYGHLKQMTEDAGLFGDFTN